MCEKIRASQKRCSMGDVKTGHTHRLLFSYRCFTLYDEVRRNYKLIIIQ